VRKIKGILIKPLGNGKGEITEVKISQGEIKDIYELLECSLIDVVDIGTKNSVFVDDEGLNKQRWDEEGNTLNPKFFTIKHNSLRIRIGAREKHLAGNGLVLGLDRSTGDSVDTTFSIEDIRDMIRFEDEEFLFEPKLEFIAYN
jgi:hypothetical protein